MVHQGNKNLNGNEPNNNLNGNNPNNNDGGVSCNNRLIRLGHIVIPLRITRQTEMKTRLLQILYANRITCLDHKDPYTHLQSYIRFLVHLEHVK